MANFVECPNSFDGMFEEFYSRYVEPSLPSVERVREFDGALEQYLAMEKPTYIVRMVKGMTRGEPVLTQFGDKILPSDNAPGWWLHRLLVSNAPIDFGQTPTHMFEVRGRTLNSAGFHLAHIYPAKNWDTNWYEWKREELRRRFLLNLHPCNWFLIAKAEWRSNGGRADILDWIKAKYVQRYGDIFQRFVEFVGGPQIPAPSSPDYSFDSGGVDARSRRTRLAKTARRSSDQPADKRSTKRPILHSKLVGTDAQLAIEFDQRRYVLPHDELLDWVAANTNALNSDSWLQKGVYHWPKPSRAMLEFLRQYERK